jgi:type I restriction enzyme M protein
MERRLWEAADQLRTNSKLTSTDYYMPVLGSIFLRHSFNRFLVVKEEVEKNLPKRGGVARPIKKDDFAQKSPLFLPEKSRFDYLLNLPADKDRGQAMNGAMDAIEEDAIPHRLPLYLCKCLIAETGNDQHATARRGELLFMAGA